MTEHQLCFDRLFQSFFNCFLKRRPVTASFIGKHEYDAFLPDFSPKGVEETVAEMEAQLAQFRGMSEEGLTPRQCLDKKQAEGFLEIQLWEFSEGCHHFHRGNPSLYSGEAVFGLIACILTQYAPVEQRFAAMRNRMEAMPGFFAQAVQNLGPAHREWTRRAIRECDAGVAFLRNGLARAVESHGYRGNDWQAASKVAEKALLTYRDFMENTLLLNHRDDVAAGRDAFTLMMEKAHFADLDLQTYAAYAQFEVDRASAYLAEHAADFDAQTPAEALAKLQDTHPDAEHYLERYHETWNAVKALSDRCELLTWPEFPIEYIPRYSWANECASGLYFLFYRAPAAFNRPIVHEYLAFPLPANATQAEMEAFLRSNNDEVIKNNHVVHHGSIGHHVQNWNAYHQTNSFIGQFAACDGASRLALPSSATMAEGWAVYATRLVSEFGFLTPLERYAEMQSHRRMAARTVVDIKLHTGEFTLEQAAAYYQEHAAMPAGAALGEAVKNSMFPGGAMIYLYGCDTIVSFREAVMKHQGDAFRYKAFHDDFLSFGSVPVSLVRAELEKKYGM